MERRIYWIISCAILLMFNVVLLAERTNEVVSENAGSVIGESVIDSYQSSFIDLLENDGLPIQDMGILDMADNSVKALSELFVDDSVLFICRVSQFQCQDCAGYALEKAIELVENDSTGMKLLFTKRPLLICLLNRGHIRIISFCQRIWWYMMCLLLIP